MKRSEVFEKTVEIARDVFENNELVFCDETSAADVEQWDSLTHMSLISDIEDEFGIEFTLMEITASENFGELVDTIVKHLG